MKIGIIGLGLMGGSAAKAYKEAGHVVYGFDTDSTVLGYALLDGIVDDKLEAGKFKECDMLLLAAYPDAVIGYLEQNGPSIPAGTIVLDFCGIKRHVCQKCVSLAEKYGFIFVGGHPMAGLQYSGLKYSRANLFQSGSMIIVPPTFDDIALLGRVRELLEPLHFKKFIVTTAENHDRMIAYTSQMCHIVSNAYVKSPCAQQHRGYSAGSFRDLTRVARLNETMWTELFLENRDNLINELNLLIDHLSQYRDALRAEDAETLCKLLRDGRVAKEQSEA